MEQSVEIIVVVVLLAALVISVVGKRRKNSGPGTGVDIKNPPNSKGS